MGLIFWIKKKIALKKAKEQEKEKIVDDSDFEKIDKDFNYYSSKIKNLFLPKKKEKKQEKREK